MEENWKANVHEQAQFLYSDLPDPQSLGVELYCWKLKWVEHQGEKPLLNLLTGLHWTKLPQ